MFFKLRKPFDGTRLKKNCLQISSILILCALVVDVRAQETLESNAGPNANDASDNDQLTASEMELIRAVEKARIKVIEKVVGSVVAVYGKDRQGGGSGVIIDPDGTALTNHHVIAGAGVSGLGGLADGNLYEWDLIGTDPGGDVAIIKLKGKDAFPYSAIGDSDQVKIGDWALAMGNPFLLAHDQYPTVTLGVVSGVERYQGGAGGNQLVYGNCIQIDSSINPGNSGGPLFNMNGEVIGINGRGSFRDRGRVNVGLGYAISSNQIKNFMPDLMATKLVEHGTLDASFSNRGGSVVCSTINLDSPIAKAGLELGDRLLKFEGKDISYANQFTNMICTLPEDWPATLTFVKQDGREITATVRLFGLPYNIQPDEEETPTPPEGDPEEEDSEKGEQEKDDSEQDDSEDADDESGNEDPGEQSEDDQDDDGDSEDTDEGDDEKGDDEEGDKGDGEPPIPTQVQQQNELKKLMTSEPGVVLNQEINQEYVQKALAKWRVTSAGKSDSNGKRFIEIKDRIDSAEEGVSGEQRLVVSSDGRVRVEFALGDESAIYGFDGKDFWSLVDGEREQLTLIQAKTNIRLTQALSLAAMFTETAFASFGNPILDGSDQAVERLASRVMYLDEDDDWFYCWLSLYDANGQPHVELLKVSDSRDGDKHGGAMTFRDWRTFDDVTIPYKKSRVRGLAETVEWTAWTIDCRWIESVDDQQFNLTQE